MPRRAPNIAKSVIEDYLARSLPGMRTEPRNLHDWKDRRITQRQLEQSTGVAFTTKPRAHQLICTAMGLRFNRLLFLLDPGLGKTKIALDLTAMRGKRAIVCVPSLSNVEAWRSEIHLHRPDLTVGCITGEKAFRHRVARRSVDILVMTYAGLLALVCDRIKKRGMVPDPKRIDQLISEGCTLVLDESTMFRNHESLICRVLLRATRRAGAVYALTGTPFGGDPTDLWSQFRVVDRGETFGSTITPFRFAFFNPVARYFGGVDWKIKPKSRAIIKRWIKNRSVRYRASECLDLPPVTRQVVKVILPPKTLSAYDHLAQELRDNQEDRQVVQNAFLRMRTLSSGYMVHRSEMGDSVVVEFKHNPKLDELVRMLSGLPPTEKAIVFLQYQHAGAIACARLKREGIKHLRLYSGTSKKEQVVRQFMDRADPHRVLVSSSAGAYGLNLQAARYLFFYETPTDPITREQMEKRVHRLGQTRPVVLYDMVCAGTADERILKSLASRQDLIDQLINGKVIL